MGGMGETTSNDGLHFAVQQVSSTLRTENSKLRLADISESADHEHRNHDEDQSQNAISSWLPNSWMLQADNQFTGPDFFAASLNQADEHFPSQLETSAHTHYQPHLQGSTVMNDIMRANGSTTAHTNANRLYHFAPTSIHTSPTLLLQLSNERHSFFIPPIFSNSRANIIWRTYYGNDSALFCMGPKSPFFSNRSPHTSNLRLMGILWH